MKTLKDIIALRKRKYVVDEKNPSYTDFWQGYFEGWKRAYQDIEEILEQNDFNLDVPVIGETKTDADCTGCRWRGVRPQRCSCCRRNIYMKDNYEVKE